MSNLEIIEETDGIAIVGMAGRFPRARNIDQFWQNLRAGVEAISFFSEEELRAAGVDSALLADPAYVRANAILEDTKLFDASFFGINHREAEMMDPQHRIFLECAWEALENAGYDAETYQGRVGVFAGHGLTSYLLSNLYPNRQTIWAISGSHSLLGNDKDFLSTRVSYKLNLKGPSLSVQTACSTSLVAVHLACQSLLNGECSLALAGGVTITIPQKAGYKYEQGGILSPDGHCRAFDASAKGTVNGSGVGIVVLKRLEDALAEGDTIHAIIKGSAINNDGSQKAGYTAPSVEGQAAVISEAMHMAGVDAATINYVEAHGTGTVLGDPIEVAALTQAFRAVTPAKEFCAIGSVKTAIGHLDTAAGVAGLIKTVLALKNRELPPSLHYQQPNPAIDFANSPFYVNATLNEWTSNGTPRRAGVSSFGIGGTNAHVIVEESPRLDPAGSVRPLQLLVLSARTDSALKTAAANLAQHLQQHPELNLADVAYTLQLGRKSFDHRLALVCSDLDDASAALETVDTTRVNTSIQETNDHPVVFMFPGQGAQHLNMGAELYETELVFREQVDRCSVLLQPLLECDLRSLLYPPLESAQDAAARLKQTMFTQPALFVVEYALAKLWMSWGVSPRAMIGHSIGEYVAACLAGVLTLEDALKLVAARGRLMQSVPEGAMTSVSLSEAELAPLLDNRLAIAAINGPSFCVISGMKEVIEAQEVLLNKRGYLCRRLHTSHAFHSGMMDSIIEPFVSLVQTVRLSPPKRPYISNLTGTWITAAEAMDPHYWSRHLRETVRFDAGVRELLKTPDSILLETGPGKTLTTLTQSHVSARSLHSLPGPRKQTSELRSMLDAAAGLWLAGRRLDWAGFSSGRRQRRIPLPTYPFERKRYWIDSRPENIGREPYQLRLNKRAEISDWFYTPLWKQSPALALVWENGHEKSSSWLVFGDNAGLGPQIGQRLEQAKQEVFTAQIGEQFERLSEKTFTINPERPEDYRLLFKELARVEKSPARIVHLWTVTPEDELAPASEADERSLKLGFYSLLFLAQALGGQSSTEPVHIDVVSSNMQSIAGEKELCPEKATLLGPCRVIPQEYPHLTCRSIDVVLRETGKALADKFVSQLMAELAQPLPDTVVAYRNGARWVQFLEPVSLKDPVGPPAQLRDGGVYLLTGGLGGIALELAVYLAKTVRAKLALVGRSEMPPQAQWAEWLTTHDAEDSVSRRIRKLQAVEQHGGEAFICCGDVTDRKRMQEVVAEIQQRFGVLNGVVHAAGVESGGLIQLRSAQQAAAVLAPKVRGLRALEFALDNVDLDFLLLCSSLTSVVGSIGQVDYCAANQFMDSFARYDTLRSGRNTIAVNWDAWQDVGLATRRADWFKAKGESVSRGRKMDHPLLGECVAESPDRKEYVIPYNVAQFWTLDEHRIEGHSLLPGTAYLEIARAAFEDHTKTSAMELTDFYFLNIFRLGESEIKEAHTLLERNEGAYRFVVRSKTENSWQEHAIGKLTQVDIRTTERHDLDAISERCGKEVDLSRGNVIASGLGPRWQCVKSLRLGSDELFASIELPAEFSSDLEHYKLHPAIIDVVTGAAKQYLADGASYLPLSYKKVSIRAPLSRRVYAHAKAGVDNQQRQEVLTFDAVIMDEEGNELVNIEGFSARKIGDSVATIKALTEQNQNGNQESSVTVLTEASREKALDHDPISLVNLSNGLTADEGVEVFGRILSGNGLAQVVVSPTDIHALMQQAKELTQVNIAAQAETLKPLAPKSLHARPDLETPYVGPRDTQERKLAEIWQTFLGVEQIGIHDNFFELGGDSVVAIHFIARANEEGLQLSPQQLFNNPTIAALARIADELSDGSNSSENVHAPPSAFEMLSLDEGQLSAIAKSLG
jgi:acyl transferase domain-containing protein/aryl carrier-like protein